MFGFRSKKKPKTSEQSHLCLLRCAEMAHTMCLPVTVPSKCNTCKRKYSVCFRNDACMRDNELLQSAIKGDMSSPTQSSTVNYRIDHLPLPFIGLYSMEYCNHTPHWGEGGEDHAPQLSESRVSLHFLVSSNPWTQRDLQNSMMALSIPRRSVLLPANSKRYMITVVAWAGKCFTGHLKVGCLLVQDARFTCTAV